MGKMKNLAKYISLFFAVSFFSISVFSQYAPLTKVALAGDQEDFDSAFQSYGNGKGDVSNMVGTLEKNGVLKSKEDSINNVMYYLLSPGNYMNDVSKGVYGDDSSVDKSVVTETDGKKTICGNTDEPQNLLNHNCDIPSFGTELFQNIISSWDVQGVVNAERTTAVAGWGFGVPANIPGDTVPVNPSERVYKYTALELFGYNLNNTSYLGEWDNIKTSSSARLLSNYGFFGKATLTGSSILNGIGAGLNAAVSEFSWNPLQWVGNIIDSAAGGVLWTIIDTSDMNVAVTHSWTRPTFSNTLYNAYYMSDEQVTEKGQAEFQAKVYSLLKVYASQYPELAEMFALKIDEESFPKFSYNKGAIKSTNADGSNNYKTQEEQFAEWKQTPNVANIIERGRAVGIDCDASTNYSAWTSCWAKEWEDYSNALISGGENTGDNGYVSSSDKLTNKAVSWAKDTEITFIGDSLMVGVTDYLLGYFPNAQINAKESRSLNNANVDENLDGYRTMLKMKEAGEIKETVVIALGTNNGFTEKQLKKFIDDLPKNVKNIVLVTTRSDVSVRKEVSERMKAVASEYDNVKVLDWNAEADSWGWGQIVAADGVHMSNYQPYAQYLTQGLYVLIGNGSSRGTTVSEKYAKIFEDISKAIQSNLLDNNKYLNPSQGISHYVCADSEGNPIGLTMSEWKYLYTDFNTKNSENLNSECAKVRPSIKGGLYGTGDGNNTDTRYQTYLQQADGFGNVSRSGVGWFGRLSRWWAVLFTKITNSLLSLSFSNILETLGITGIIKTTIISFRDGIFFPLVVMAIASTAVYVVFKYVLGGQPGAFRTLLGVIGTFLLGIIIMFKPDTLVSLTEEIPNKIDNAIANIMLAPAQSQSDNLCSATGGNSTGVRTMQCKVWELGVFQPWVFSQFGTSWEDLDSSKMTNTNGDLVGDASVNMGGNIIVKNWALYQLQVTKSGTITTYDTSVIDGETSKNIYKLVDLQFGPNKGAASDKRYSKQWSGMNGGRGSYMFKGALVSFAVMMVVGTLSIAKIEMTVMFSVYLLLLPIMFLLGLFPAGKSKLRDYGMTMLNFYIKRMVVVTVISFTLSVLTIISNGSDDYNTISWFMVVFALAAKLYYKEMVNLFTVSTGSFSDAFGTQIGQMRESIKKGQFVPNFAKRYVNQKVQGTKEGIAGGVGGAIAGTMQAAKDLKDGKTTQTPDGSNIILHGLKEGVRQGTKRGESFAFNRARREGLGILDTSLQAHREAKKQLQEDARHSDSNLYHDLQNLKSIIGNKKHAQTSKEKELKKTARYGEYVNQQEEVAKLEEVFTSQLNDLSATIDTEEVVSRVSELHGHEQIDKVIEYDDKLEKLQKDHDNVTEKATSVINKYFERLGVKPENAKETLQVIGSLPEEELNELFKEHKDLLNQFQSLQTEAKSIQANASILKAEKTVFVLEATKDIGSVIESESIITENLKQILETESNLKAAKNKLDSYSDVREQLDNIQEDYDKLTEVERLLEEKQQNNYIIDNATLNKAIRSYKPGQKVYNEETNQFDVVTESVAADQFINNVFNAAQKEKSRIANSRTQKLKNAVSFVDETIKLSETLDKQKAKVSNLHGKFIDKNYGQTPELTPSVTEYEETEKVVRNAFGDNVDKEIIDRYTKLGVKFGEAGQIKQRRQFNSSRNLERVDKTPKYTKESLRTGFESIFNKNKE